MFKVVLTKKNIHLFKRKTGTVHNVFRIQDLQCTETFWVTSMRFRTMTSIFHRFSRVSPEDAQSLGLNVFCVPRIACYIVPW